MLAERGLGLTVDDVARTAGTTRMTVYRHFGTREELVTTLVMTDALRLAEELRPVVESDRPFAERLTEAFVHVVREVRATPHLRAAVTRANPAEEWPLIDPEERFLSAVWDFFHPVIEAAATEVRLRADVDRTLDWLLRQMLLQLLVPGLEGLGEDELRAEIEDFVLPSILADT